MKVRKLLVLLFVGALMAGCGGSKEVQDDSGNLPSWYTNPPSSDNEYMYAIGEGMSSRRSMARKQAMQNGRAQLTIKLKSEVSAMQKNFSEESTSGANSNYSEVFTDVSKTVAQQTLRGVETEKSAFYRRQNNTKHEVLMLVKMPVGEAANSLNQALENTLSKDEELYTKFKSSKAFEEMQESIENMGNGNMPSGN